MSKLYYPAVFHETKPDEKGYWVEFPDLPGCLTQGETLEEAAEMAEDALGTWLSLIHISLFTELDLINI